MEGTPSVAAPEPRRPPSHRLRLVVLGVVVLAALLAITGLLLGHGSGSSGMRTITTTAPARSLAPLGPIAATPAVLTTIAKAAGSPIYWLGAEAGYTYELTRTRNGNVYVRYLPQGATVGNRRASYRVVATYPYAGALAAVKAFPGGKQTALPHEAWSSRRAPIRRACTSRIRA